MRAIVRGQFGGPEDLVIPEAPVPDPVPGTVKIQVLAFGLNHAETRGRKGGWGDFVKISGIGCAGLVEADASGRLAPGPKVAAILGGLAPISSFNPLRQMPSGIHFSFFGSLVCGTREFPVSEVRLQTIVDRVASGACNAKPARVFRFEEIQEAHRSMESNQANGKIVVTV